MLIKFTEFYHSVLQCLTNLIKFDSQTGLRSWACDGPGRVSGPRGVAAGLRTSRARTPYRLRQLVGSFVRLFSSIFSFKKIWRIPRILMRLILRLQYVREMFDSPGTSRVLRDYFYERCFSKQNISLSFSISLDYLSGTRFEPPQRASLEPSGIEQSVAPVPCVAVHFLVFE